MNIYTILLLYLINPGLTNEIWVDPNSGHFVDSSGRVRLFRGINSVIKGDPWYDPKYLNETRIKELADLGFNVLRLGSMWSGVEPEGPGKTDIEYMNILETITSLCKKYNIYVILDMHQDVLWREEGIEGNDYYGYYGVPKWLKEKLPSSENPYPWPFVNPPSGAQWACGYFVENINKGFDHIYKNTNGAGDDLANVWQKIASVFKKHSNILGYELLNEPWAGNIYDDVSVLLPGNAGSRNLVPMYEKISNAIRDEEPDAMILWEPTTWGIFFPINTDVTVDSLINGLIGQVDPLKLMSLVSLHCGELVKNETVFEVFNGISNLVQSVLNGEENPNVLGPGFKTVPGGDDYLNRTAMAWHYYCWASPGGSKPYNPTMKILCDTILGSMSYESVKMRSKQLGGSGTILTEFGLCVPNTNEDENSVNNAECKFLFNKADEYFMSWTYWDTAFGGTLWDSHDNLIPEVAIGFTRPYPIATNGSPYKLSFDFDTKMFEYQYYPSEDNSLVTEIFVPSLIYPNQSYKIELSSDLEYQVSLENSDIIFVSHKHATDKVSYVKILPK